VFTFLVEEIRCAMEDAPKYSKSDRQHAFMGKMGGSVKQQRAAARELHGHPDDPDDVFRKDAKGYRATRPGHGSWSDKERAKIFGGKFKYSKKYKRSAVGPSGKLPEDREYQEGGGSRASKRSRQIAFYKRTGAGKAAQKDLDMPSREAGRAAGFSERTKKQKSADKKSWAKYKVRSNAGNTPETRIGNLERRVGLVRRGYKPEFDGVEGPKGKLPG